MKKSMLFFAMIAILCLAACRKKHKDVEVEFLIIGASYCGDLDPLGTQYCPTLIRIVDNCTSWVFNQPLDTAITNKHNWWNKKYIATLEEQKESCECFAGYDPQPGYELTPVKKPIVKIKSIKLKE